MSDTKRKALIVIVLVLVILFGVGQFFAYSNVSAPAPTTASSTSNPPAQTPTQVIAYMPTLSTSSTPIEKGSCFAGSVAAPYRSDAYRCTVGNAISDPCFIMPGEPGMLACGVNPASTNTSSSFILQLTKALPSSATPSSTPPNWAWFVELKDGTICTPFTGTRPFTATGDVAVYSCNGSSVGEGLIFGDLNNSSSVWTAEVGALSTATSTFPPVMTTSSTVPVAAVWQ